MGLCCYCVPSCCPAETDWCCERGGMGYTGAAVLASATTPPVVDEDGVTTLALPYHQCLPWQLSARKSITILGRIPDKPYRWVVNLMMGGMNNDYALHVNSRHDAGYVVRNAKHHGDWGTEEICADPPMPFKPGDDFELTILCTENAFLLSVNGRHFATFRARVAVTSVSTLFVDGTVRLYGVAYADDVTFYPPVMAPTLHARPGSGYCTQQPVLPCRLPEPVCEGGHVTISGRVKLLPFSFAIDLLNGAQLIPAPSIILHMNARFQIGGDFDVVVLNSRPAAGWGGEERPAAFPFRPGRNFTVTLLYERESWLIQVDGTCLARFAHRLSPDDVTAINVHGDVIVDSVQYEPTRDLIKL